jgi:DNA-binding IscR family transcriptional regulator
MGPYRRIPNYIGRDTVARCGHLLSGLRGPRGGYRLIRSPAESTVAEVLACPYEQIVSKPTPEVKHR